MTLFSKRIGCLAICVFSLSLINASPIIRLKAGMVIKESAIISRETYLLNAPLSLTENLVLIDGNNLVIDFNGAILQGSVDKTRPDEFYGLAIRIKKGSKNITLKNAFIHGYKVAILADSIENLVIDNCDLSYNWRQHLQSNREKEDISDWMSFHHNENDEWLRYGAAIYLKNCLKPVISNNRVTGGQCALMMTRCNEATVFDNNFSFNSAIGIGLYRSSLNKVYHNRLDYNVRGYSHGFYKRGQDSAGILVFEQCNDNIFAFNSATHSGDGFFLWAGQSTMDTGLGGCNDNFIYGNDFSYAPTNGIEVTFSRNLLMKNILKECDHGIWGGYSFDTDITDNMFENNRIGIAIEHGQGINIALNGFTGDQTGVRLWSREKQPADWGYAKARNTESRNYWIAANRFTSVKTAFDIMGTDTVVFSGNTKFFVENALVLGDRVDNIDTSRELDLLDIDYQKDIRLKTIKADKLPVMNIPMGKKEMRITEWGPYDFNYPLLWLKNINKEGLYEFTVLGPGGKWDIQSLEGFEMVARGVDSFPSFLTTKADTALADHAINLAFTGPSFRNQFGKIEDSSTKRSFTYQSFMPKTTWDVKWFSWDATHDPANGYAPFTSLFEQLPVYTTTTDRIDFTWWGAIGKGLPADSFATVAHTRMILKEGNYILGITADDYAKVFVDGKEVIDAWDPKYTELDENTHHKIILHLTTGEHDIKIVHAEMTGLATMVFTINPQ